MTKQIHNLKQDSDDWHYFRSNHDGASEAAAMLGISPTTKRDELLHIKKTGLAKEFSDFVQQRIFAEGHRVEPLAREMVEKHIGDDLYPVVYSLGRLSASCDGITMDETIAFECKQFNQTLFDGVVAGVVPDYHMAQCQQIMMVTGANQVYFTVSDGTEENTAWTIVEPSQEWFDRINYGWNQFNIDLETFEPEPEVIKPVATLVDDLMMPVIQVSGEISVTSNLQEFGGALQAFIGRINTKPETDEDFVNIGKAIKCLERAEEWLDKQEENAISKFDQLNQNIAFKNSLKELARENRLMLQKIDKAEKENRKTEIVLIAKNNLSDHIAKLQAELPVIFHYQSVNFSDAIKGKKNLFSMKDAVNTMLANAKIEADMLAHDLFQKNNWYIENSGDYRFLFNDLQIIIYKPLDDFKLLVTTRIDQHKAQEAERLEQERQRIAAEEKAKLEREAEAKAKAEQEKAEREAAEKLKAEQTEKDRIEQETKLVKKAEEPEEPAQQPIKLVPVTDKPVGEIAKQVAETLQKTSKLKPNREALILVVADSMQVDKITAEAWLLAAFNGETAESLHKQAVDYHDRAAHADRNADYKSEMAVANKYYALAKALKDD
jgi:putative phage-type endonuclease